ncbi:putative ABC transport system permease protein [Filimonas lacunae]|uniref:Putative ABC transport system permease protein n=1 Tax=Filimonas lacunae TaxID=477680 RepID=A0A173MDT7_9BACT|nr:ABC transporter permease [Filimonas lacunae]BAV05763.1 ABC transporter, permease protein [Filimonas lacunae]SIT28689.1 putative ABC transport system permease protein [Filimonas lacunae]
MFKNYLKVAWRNLTKHKVFSFINIMGLAVGLTACFLIFLYVKFEVSYDSFHSKKDRIFRLSTDVKTPSDVMNVAISSWAIGPAIKAEFPEIESCTRVSGDNLLVKRGDVKFQETEALAVDSNFLQVFDYKLAKGNPAEAFKEPWSVVFTESSAKKYFGNENPIGQTVLITGEQKPAKVTGILADMPENTQLKADMFLSMSTYHQERDEMWGNYGAVTYMLLKPGVSAAALNKKFPGFVKRRIGKMEDEMQMHATYILEPLKNLYLHSKREGMETGSITNVYIFSVVAVFILLIACINFVNLTTARATERAKEVGIRKVAGAQKTQLAGQFLGETLLICIAAFLFALLLSGCLLPLFNQLAGKKVSVNIFHNGPEVLLLLVASLGIGLLAGLYPALVLSNFQPIAVLKGRFSSGAKGLILRRGLVVTQFTISICLMVATIIVYKQMNYMNSRDLGFVKDQILVLETRGDEGQEALKNAVASIPGVQSVSLSASVPGGGNSSAYSEIQNQQGAFQVTNLNAYFVDFDFMNQYGMKIIAGRGFSRDFGADTTQAMILNEKAVKRLGFASAKDAVGKHFKQWGREGTIVGVVKDFHFRSLLREIEPLSIRIEPQNCELLSVKVSAKSASKVIAELESKWKVLIPKRPFNYFFLDEYFDKQYRGQKQFGKLFFNFSILAIFISCLGLLGLASYSTLQRTREIGVRKVLGASVSNIVNLLSTEFLKLVLVSFVVAVPLSWFFMHRWLKEFAYRSDIPWWVFAAAGVIAILVTLFTISFQAIKAAVANPVRSLRTE